MVGWGHLPSEANSMHTEIMPKTGTIVKMAINRQLRVNCTSSLKTRTPKNQDFCIFGKQRLEWQIFSRF